MIPAALLQAAVSLDLSRDKISADDTVDLILKLDDTGPPSIPEIPLPAGLKIIGTSRQETLINFVRESEVRYTLQPEKEGTYQIGPFKLEGNKKGGEIPALTLTVTAPKVIQSTDNLFVTLDSTTNELMVHETVELTLSIYSRETIGNINILDFPGDGLEITKWQQIQAPSKQIGQKVYRVHRFVAQLTPTKAGLLKLDPNFRVEVLDHDEPFGMMFGTRSSRILRLMLQEPLTLTVKDPPEAGRPDDFAGHLGNFRLDASVSPREVNVGDPVTLRVELSGSGSLQQALPPGLKESDDFKVYKPKLIVENYQRDGLNGRKVIEQVVIPKHPGVKEIPALTFSYYDTGSKSYKTLQAGPFPLNVKKASSSGGVSIVSSLPSGGQTTEPTMLGNDLIYLKTRPGKIRPSGALQPGWTFAGLSGFPFAVWALMGLVIRKKEQSEKDMAGRRRQLAPRRLRKHLQSLEQGDVEIHARIWTVLTEYLSARLNLPPGELNAMDVEKEIRNQVEDSTAESLKDWMRRCERARFAGGASAENTEKIRGEFNDFILKLDRELGR